jgi:hypothetical protein
MENGISQMGLEEWQELMCHTQHIKSTVGGTFARFKKGT